MSTKSPPYIGPPTLHNRIPQKAPLPPRNRKLPQSRTNQQDHPNPRPRPRRHPKNPKNLRPNISRRNQIRTRIISHNPPPPNPQRLDHHHRQRSLSQKRTRPLRKNHPQKPKIPNKPPPNRDRATHQYPHSQLAF